LKVTNKNIVKAETHFIMYMLIGNGEKKKKKRKRWASLRVSMYIFD